MTKEQFDKWLKGLKAAWESKDPQAAVEFCADNVIWYEDPFSEPLRTKEEIYTEWQTVPYGQKDITVSYEILVITDGFGIAHWSGKFTRVPSGEKADLDGIYKVSLNKDGLCTEFHQWWNSKA